MTLPEGESFASAITRLKVRESAYSCRFNVIRSQGKVYALFDSKVKSRSRWGTLQEILVDVMYVIEFDSLPPASGGRW